MSDYMYNKKFITLAKKLNQVITSNEQWIQGLHKHFTSKNKKSQLIAHISLTEIDYDNMQYIAKHADIFNFIIKKYSTLDIQYPILSHEEIATISSLFIVDCTVDFSKQKFIFNEKQKSHHYAFVLLYLRTIELIQICIDIYNEYERTPSQKPLIPLKNGIAFIGSNRSLHNIPHKISPHTWNELIADKNSSTHYLHLGFYLCVKKIWNVMSKHRSLKMTKKDIANYPERLENSEFFRSLSFIIKKYLHKTLVVEYRNDLLEFYLVDEFGAYLSFSELSDGEQSLLSMIFTMYGYDLKKGMIVIDEPEIHFHPQMQRSFSRMIETISHNIGTQFVLSTYSPLFINESNI